MSTNLEKVSLLFAGQELQLEYGFASAIQKEFNRLEDGTVLTEKHTITIRGAFSAVGYSASERHEDLLVKSVEYADYKAIGVIDRLVSLQAGPLALHKMQQVGDTFTPVTPPLVIYDFAQLMNVSVSEPPEDTAGIHYQEVTFTFESITPPTDTIGHKYRLKTASEQFEIKKEEDKMSFFVAAINNLDNINNIDDDPYYSYSITHTLSAQGQPIFYNSKLASYNNYTNANDPSNPNSVDAINNQKYEAFYEAYKYVNDKKKDTLIGVLIDEDIFGRKFVGSNKFIPVGWEVSNNPGTSVQSIVGAPTATGYAATGIISKTLWAAATGQIHSTGNSPVGYERGRYGEYNITRSSSVDIPGGTYSLTTNYYYSRNPASIEINGVYEKGEDGDDVVRIEGTIQGLDSLGVNSDKHNKFKNAKKLFKTLITSGVFKTNEAPDAYTYNKTQSSAINHPITVAQASPIYPSSAFPVQTSGNVIIDLANAQTDITTHTDAGLGSPLGSAGLRDPWNVRPSIGDQIFLPWGYGTILYAFANSVFEENAYSSDYAVGNVIDYRPTTTSVTENKIAGTIQFSATYKAMPETVRALKAGMGNALSVNITEQQDNFIPVVPDGGTQANAIIQTSHVVPVMILGRKNGPIIQDMKTTKESKRTVQIEAIYGPEYRYPNSPVVQKGLSAAAIFIPTGDYNAGLAVKPYLTDLNYQWDWPAGKLSITMGWIFTKAGTNL